MMGSWSRRRAGSSETWRTTRPRSQEVPAGEKKGSVRKLTPLISRMAVAVPMWVMFRVGDMVGKGSEAGCFGGVVGAYRGFIPGIYTQN